MNEVKRATYVVTKPGTSFWWFRRTIPGYARAAFAPKTEFFFSLETRDLAEANKKAQLETIKTEQEIAHTVRLHSASPAQELDADEIARIAALYHAHLLKEDEDERLEVAATGGFSERKWENKAFGLDIVATHETQNASRAKLGDTYEEEDFAHSLGVRVLPDSPSFVPLMVAMKASFRQAFEAIQARHDGAVVPTPQIESLVIRTEPRKEETLDTLAAYWKLKAAPGRSAVGSVQTIIKKFRRIVGDMPASKVRKEHIVTLEDALLVEKVEPATINKDIGLLAAVFQLAVENGKLPANPLAGRKKLKVPASTEEHPYTLEELRLIFSSPVFTQGERPSHGKGEAAFWMPLIGLYTGARVAEVGQLFVEDVQEEAGYYCFNIKNDATTGRRVKNAGSSRRVPVHPELIRMGFLDYLKATQEAGHQQLFPLLKVTRTGGKLTDKWRGWWAGYVRSLGITRISQPFHAFRHTFKDACRISQVPIETHHRLTGHSTGNEGDGYGGGNYPMQPLHDGLCRVRYHGLDLSHLHRPPQEAPVEPRQDSP
jgi:integrase